MQNIALSMAQHLLPSHTHLYQRFIDESESKGFINRKVEFLPSNKTIDDRVQQGKLSLTRPELAVLLTYSKLILQRQLLDTDLVDDPYVLAYVDEAFPAKMVKLYGDKLRTHYLKHALASMQVSNHVVMELGITFVQQMRDEMGLSEMDVVKAFVAVREILGVQALFDGILNQFDALSGDLIIELLMDLRRLIRRSTRWLLRNGSDQSTIEALVLQYKDGFAALWSSLAGVLPSKEAERYAAKKQALLAHGFDTAQVKNWAIMPYAHSMLNILKSAHAVSADPKMFISFYFMFSEQLGVSRLQDYINRMTVANRWAMSARIMMKARLEKHLRDLIIAVYQHAPVQTKKDSKTSVASWMETHQVLVLRWQEVLGILEHHAKPDVTMLSVLIDELIDFGSNILMT